MLLKKPLFNCGQNVTFLNENVTTTINQRFIKTTTENALIKTTCF
ncbi:hypothetical protein DEU42_104207 [Flavobacterium sp. AG291]|nr:hypothetical protein DEU42_104207 [Flavobacterium sp. AG291]